MATLTTLPTLDELAIDPTRAEGLGFDALYLYERMAERISFACRLEMIRQVAQERGLVNEPSGGGDRLLTVREAAQALGLAYASLLRRRNQVPYRDLLVPVAGTRNLRFSAARIAQYLQSAVNANGARRTRGQ